MAGTIFSVLTARQRAAIPLIQGAVKRGLSTNAIIKLLDKRKMGIRFSVLRKIVNTTHAESGAGLHVSKLTQGQRPNPLRFPEALGKIRRNYSFTVEVEGIGFDNSVQKRYVTVVSDSLLTKDDIEHEASSFIEDDLASYGIEEITSIGFVSARKAGPAGIL